VTDPSDAPLPSDTGASAIAGASPAGAKAGRELDDLAREFERQFSAAADAGVPLQDLPIPARRLPEGQIVGVLFPPEATPDYLICSLGPCIHYSTQVVHLETKNQEVSQDGIAHAERTHWCDHFKRDLDDRIFDCSRWEVAAGGECAGPSQPWVGQPGTENGRCGVCGRPTLPDRRGNSLSHAPAWPLIRAAHLSKIRIVPEAVTGYSTCGVCKKLRERSGVCDWAGREDYAHRWALAAEAIDVRAAMNKEWPVSSFCACGEHPDRIPKEW